MTRRPELRIDFVARYEIEILDRIVRDGAPRVLGFPGPFPIDPQRDVTDGVVVRVRGETGAAWVGLFENGRQSTPPAVPRQVLAWPDERSVCVIEGGVGYVVRCDDPARHYEIECWPICDLLVIPSRDLIVFADYTGLFAYGPDGKRWATERLVWDDLRIIRADEDRLIASGYDPTSARRSPPEFAVDLDTGEAFASPYIS